jgi:hypothetical protein
MEWNTRDECAGYEVGGAGGPIARPRRGRREEDESVLAMRTANPFLLQLFSLTLEVFVCLSFCVMRRFVKE